MDPLEHLVELRLQEAEEQGLLRDNPLVGQPLPPDDDLGQVAPELRGAYRLLKQAGYLPEEMELRRANAKLVDLIAAATDEGERRELAARLTAQRLRYDLLMERRGASAAADRYRASVLRRLG